MRYMRKGLCLWLVMLAVIMRPAAAEEAAKFEPYEAWYVLKLGGQKAGHMHVRLYEEDGKLVSTSDMILAIKRGEVELRIEQRSRFVETKEYKPIHSTSSMKLALMDTEQSIDFTGDKWVVSATNAGQTTKTEVNPPEGGWLTPGGLAAYTKQAIDRGDEEITATYLDPSMGVSPVTVTMKRGETNDIEVFGRVIPATKWSLTMTDAPGSDIEQWTDASGQPVKQMNSIMPGMEFEMLLADKELATAELDAPELLASSLITPDKRIKNPRTLKRAVFELVGDDIKEKIGNAVPNAGYQHTGWVDDNTLRVTIDFDMPVIPERFDVDDAYLASTAMLNHDDEAVEKLVEETGVRQRIERESQKPSIKPGWESVRKGAQTLRDAAREHIDSKDLSVGFASASEVARTGKGDCTEHACLLTAMLRGAGIPARTVTGLVYADQFAGREGVFGYHMWSQAWITDDDGKQRWVDLDAAMPGDIDGFDATHIALSTSAMKEGETFNDMVTLLPLMQDLSIKVVETAWAE